MKCSPLKHNRYCTSITPFWGKVSFVVPLYTPLDSSYARLYTYSSSLLYTYFSSLYPFYTYSSTFYTYSSSRLIIHFMHTRLLVFIHTRLSGLYTHSSLYILYILVFSPLYILDTRQHLIHTRLLVSLYILYMLVFSFLYILVFLIFIHTRLYTFYTYSSPRLYTYSSLYSSSRLYTYSSTYSSFVQPLVETSKRRYFNLDDFSFNSGFIRPDILASLMVNFKKCIETLQL